MNRAVLLVQQGAYAPRPRPPVAEAPPLVLSAARAQAIAEARRLLGTPYEIALPGYPRQPGRGFGKRVPPDGGIDCSGYVLQALNAGGVLLGLNPLYTSVDVLWRNSRQVAREQTLPGDLVVFEGTYDTPGLSHVGLVADVGAAHMLDAREPVASYDALDAPFWLAHLVGFGRPNGL